MRSSPILVVKPTKKKEGVTMSTVRVTTIDAATKVVSGTCDGKDWSAAPFQWGGKMLMKITDEFREGFSQGEKVSIGRAAKNAMRTANVEIPTAVLKRPRVPKPVEGVVVIQSSTSSNVATTDLDIAHAEALAILAAAGEDGGEVSDPNMDDAPAITDDEVAQAVTESIEA